MRGDRTPDRDREELEYAIHNGLGAFLHRCEGAPPALDSVTIYHTADRFRRYYVNCRFAPDQHFAFQLPEGIERLGLRQEQVCDRCREVYNRLFEDHMVNLEVRQRRRVYEEALERRLPPDQLWELDRNIRARERHIREHHQNQTIRVADYQQMMEVTGITTQALGVPDRALSATALRMCAEQARHMDRMIEEVMYRGMDYGRVVEVGDPAAQDKGLALLKENLTPVQLEQYEKRQHFEVVGCDTRKLYRIRHGRQMNIEELDKRHRRVCGWCFLPSGGLVVGDTMLAQKIALETNETAALKIANRFG